MNAMQPEYIQDFVERYLNAMGAEPHIKNGVLNVKLTPELAEEIEGPRSKLTTLTLAFTERAANKEPEAELIVPGSFRLDKMVRSAAHRGRLGKVYFNWISSTAQLPPAARQGLMPHNKDYLVLGGDMTYYPHFIYRFRITYIGTDKHEGLVDVIVSLTTGDTSIFQLRSNEWQITASPQDFPFIKRRLSYQKAYKGATSYLASVLEREDHEWARDAAKEFELEKAQLEKYFADLVRESPETDIEPEKATRIKDLELRTQPKVIIRPYAGILAYLTNVYYRVSLLGTGGQTQIKYDPYSGEASLRH